MRWTPMTTYIYIYIYKYIYYKNKKVINKSIINEYNCVQNCTLNKVQHEGTKHSA